jgi:hypothetical protein
MLSNLGTIQAPGDQRLCDTKGDELDWYSPLKKHLCDGLDMSSEPGQQAALVCNAVSFGVAFSAKPAKFGRVVQRDDVTEPCPLGECVEDAAAGGAGGAGGGSGGK